VELVVDDIDHVEEQLPLAVGEVVVTGWTGVTVAVGFVLYHAVPFKSPMTNPYLGEPVGAAAWISVALAVAAGAWAAYEAFARQPY
jgi:hypothetical protein